MSLIVLLSVKSPENGRPSFERNQAEQGEWVSDLICNRLFFISEKETQTRRRFRVPSVFWWRRVTSFIPQSYVSKYSVHVTIDKVVNLLCSDNVTHSYHKGIVLICLLFVLNAFTMLWKSRQLVLENLHMWIKLLTSGQAQNNNTF